MGARRLLVRVFLQIVGQHDGGHRAFPERDTYRAVDQMPDLRRRGGLLYIGSGDVLEHRRQIDFLLVMAAQRVARLLPDDRQNRLMVGLGVVEPGDQMRSAGSGGGYADAQLAGKFGVGDGHEGCHFLMPGLDELDLALGAAQGAEHAVNAVAGIAEDLADAPGMKPFDDEVAYGLGHGVAPRGLWITQGHNPSSAKGVPARNRGTGQFLVC